MKNQGNQRLHLTYKFTIGAESKVKPWQPVVQTPLTITMATSGYSVRLKYLQHLTIDIELW